MDVRVLGEAFDPWEEVQAHVAANPALAGRYGANALFVGSLRDFNAGREVSAMRLEHYAGMTERHLRRIGEEALGRWDLLDILIIHRYGDLRPGDPIVLVSAWAGHRAPAFDACRYIVEALKTRAPFWKHEQTGEGAHWVAPSD